MKFKLKEATITVRDEQITVRELTHGQRSEWVKVAEADRYNGPLMLVSLGCVAPTFTKEEALELPSDVVETIVAKVLEISGMGPKKDTKKSKQTEASGADAVQDSSTTGEVTE
jgi:hypothetical protein